MRPTAATRRGCNRYRDLWRCHHYRIESATDSDSDPDPDPDPDPDSDPDPDPEKKGLNAPTVSPRLATFNRVMLRTAFVPGKWS